MNGNVAAKMRRSTKRSRRPSVVIFDVGGVVAESPVVAIKEFAISRGFVADTFNPFLAKSDAFAQLMNGKITLIEFPRLAFEESTHKNYADGRSIGVAGWEELARCLAAGSSYRPEMLSAIESLKSHGFKVCALTNNFQVGDKEERELGAFKARFDHFIESRILGVMKPFPQIYEEALRMIQCRPDEAVFLDDIGKNLVHPRRMGITTIKVINETPTSFKDALRELELVTGVPLLARL